ncbi:MAG: hypothetical protein KAV41_03310 [Candidatus Pacebacteria bacterium]|nr:hypothetical protein [Candidatus Paceibacterota bacterium]
MQENQNLGNKTTGENPVLAEPKLEAIESVVEVAENDGQPENLAEIVADSPTSAKVEENAEIVEPATEPPEQKVEETASSLAETNKTKIEEAGLLRELAETDEKEIPAQPQTKIIEKIIYKTDPNFVQKLLIKARAKIQERKRKKLDKIMALFDTQPEISNSKIQALFRTTKRSATRYLNILEKKQKITQIGITGRGVKYIKKQ